MLIPSGTSGSFVGQTGVGGSSNMQVKLDRSGTDRGSVFVGITAAASGGFASTTYPPGVVCFVDNPSAGTYTYKLQALVSSSTTGFVQHCEFMAKELT